MRKFLIHIFIFLIIILPVFTLAQGLVPCTNTPDAAGNIAKPCDFNAFMTLINNVINFIFTKIAVPIAAIMFVYAGFLLVTSGANPENRNKAKSIFTSTLLGLVLAAAAWLIVTSILSILGYTDTSIFFNKNPVTP